jgi:NADH:ubiquinone oxidoreductase subunit 5 (subunit L)/multisubunit Na+/H+ antiporter MnhA subunit
MSYMLVNYWNNRNECGIKAVVYNKFGDCSFIVMICIVYYYLLSFDYELLVFVLIAFVYSFSFSCILYVCVFICLGSKSA